MEIIFGGKSKFLDTEIHTEAQPIRRQTPLKEQFAKSLKYSPTFQASTPLYQQHFLLLSLVLVNLLGYVGHH